MSSHSAPIKSAPSHHPQIIDRNLPADRLHHEVTQVARRGTADEECKRIGAGISSGPYRRFVDYKLELFFSDDERPVPATVESDVDTLVEDGPATGLRFLA